MIQLAQQHVNRDLQAMVSNVRSLQHRGFPRAASAGLLAAARLVERNAKVRAPVGPTRRVRGVTIKGGRLRRSIRAYPLGIRDGGVRRAVVVAGGSYGVDYASYVEFQKPYLRPAYYSTQFLQAEAFRETFERVIVQQNRRRSRR